MTIIPIPINFDKNLLLMPTFRYNADYLHKISQFLLKKMHSAGLKKHPATMKKLVMKYDKFMELYEQAQIKERENKDKTCLKTQWIGYRPRLPNRNDQRIFDRLNNRAGISFFDRKNNNFSKVQKVR